MFVQESNKYRLWGTEEGSDPTSINEIQSFNQQSSYRFIISCNDFYLAVKSGLNVWCWSICAAELSGTASQKKSCVFKAEANPINWNCLWMNLYQPSNLLHLQETELKWSR